MEKETIKEKLTQEEIDRHLYYQYESGFILQQQEQMRLRILPHVVRPELFSKTGWALGDLRVFERLSVAPLCSLTCRFLEVPANEKTEKQRRVPALIAYILSGSGECIQDGNRYDFEATDLILVPPYTVTQFISGPQGFRAWISEARLWHQMWLLRREQFEFFHAPQGTEPLYGASGQLAGFRVPPGVLGYDNEVEVRAGADPDIEAIFQRRRSQKGAIPRKTRYDYFLNLIQEENKVEQRAPRVLRGPKVLWEDTQHGRLKFYISQGKEVAARALNLYSQEIEANGHSGKHRHMFEELLLVEAGEGYDIHEDVKYPWRKGDLICVPAMTLHQHFNSHAQEPARLISVWPRLLEHDFLGGIEHIEDASCWND